MKLQEERDYEGSGGIWGNSGYGEAAAALSEELRAKVGMEFGFEPLPQWNV